MNGKVNCLVGDTGTGKTTLIKEKYCSKVKDKDIIAYVRLDDDFDIPKAIVYNNGIKFIQAAHRAKNSLIIIDEAWTLLPDKLNIKIDNPKHPHNMLADILVNARKMNNFVFIIYHAFSQVPTQWLIPYLHYFIIYRTNDLLQYQQQRFRSFPEISKYLSGQPIKQNYINKQLKLR
jgi:hypothetical protein